MNESISDRRECLAGEDEERFRQRREELLDEALKESFPASDPPSIAQPHIKKAKP